MLHPGSSLRVIALNPLLVDSTNAYIWQNTTDKLKMVFQINS